MIDKNKIKSAAQGYCDTTYGTLNTDPFIAEAFRKGANWAINEFLKDLWHPVSKEPEKFRKILYTGGSIDTTDTTMLIINNSWNTKVCLLKIKKWCYIDDLFPKGGGNYD